MPVTVAPVDEACESIVDHINDGNGLTYTLGRDAHYSHVEPSSVENMTGLEVDVVPVGQPTRLKTLDSDDPTVHTIKIWIREKMGQVSAANAPAWIAVRGLIACQVLQRVQNFVSSDRRVKVWEVSDETDTEPDKDKWHRLKLFSATIVLRVLVEASP